MICCERCGKEIKRDLAQTMKGVAEFLSAAGSYEIWNYKIFGGKTNVALCPECKKAFRAWMAYPRETEKVTEAVYEKGENGVETHIYDEVEIHHNCYVQILSNSITGEKSFGWRPENEEE